MNTGVSVRRQLLVDDGGELVVHRLIGRPVGAAKLRPDVDQMAERPQSFVGEPAVVGLEFLALQPQAAKLVGRRIGRHAHRVIGIDDRPIGGAVTMGNPGSAPLSHQRVERHRHAARRMGQDDAAVVRVVVQVRLPVRHDDQRPAGVPFLKSCICVYFKELVYPFVFYLFLDWQCSRLKNPPLREPRVYTISCV